VVIQYSETGGDSRTLALVPERPVTPAVAPANVSVGLLGAGIFAAGTLIPVLKGSAATSLVTVCAATGSHAKHAAQKFSFRSCTTDESELLRDSSINTIVIATRHHLHANQVLAALAAWKNVFCEKPLCLTEDELHAIADAYLGIAPAARPAVMIGFNRRFAPMTARLKSFLAPISEPLALHYRINAGYIPPDHWINDREQGGGRILGEVCHFADLLTYLAASPIVEVEARAIGNSGRYSGDNIVASLRFANGSEGTISYLANGDRSYSKERLEVFGGGAVAMLEDFRRLELVRDGRKETVQSRLRQDKGHRAEWAAFTQFVLRRTEPPIRFEDVILSTLATLRIQESVMTGKRLPVDLLAFLASAQKISSQSANRNE
jgi:predicted dehydrogenase